MEFRIRDDVKLEEWFCPIYNRKIDCGLCFDISNIGDDILCLKGDDTASVFAHPGRGAFFMPFSLILVRAAASQAAGRRFDSGRRHHRGGQRVPCPVTCGRRTASTNRSFTQRKGFTYEA